jgi:hypothetical protein
MLILLVGLLFGYKQINNRYELSQSTSDLSIPFNEDFDKDFIREKSF